jgi:hypothetical protein
VESSEGDELEESSMIGVKFPEEWNIEVESSAFTLKAYKVFGPLGVLVYYKVKGLGYGDIDVTQDEFFEYLLGSYTQIASSFYVTLLLMKE